MVSENLFRPVISENIPEELKNLNQWTVWASEDRGEGKKPSKVPYYSLDGSFESVKHGSCANPSTWMSFENALNLLNNHPNQFKGLQFILPKIESEDHGDHYVIVDIDHAFSDTETLKPEVVEIINSFDSYTEFSPTNGVDGGIHIICRGSFPKEAKIHLGNFEIYQETKLLTVTGHVVPSTPKMINQAQEAIDWYRQEYLTEKSAPKIESLPVTAKKFTDREILDTLYKSKIGEEFKKLYENGIDNGDDHSTKDLWLCGKIAFYTQDPLQVERIFKGSALKRPKWDEKRGALTYGQKTVIQALESRRDVYQPKYQSNDFNLKIFNFETRSSGIYETVYKSKGEPEEKKISSTPCKIDAIAVNIDTGDVFYKLRIRDNLQRENTVWKKTPSLMTKAGVLGLMNDGMQFQERDANSIINYFDSVITTFKDQLPREFTASRSGWKADLTQFVIGSKLISKDGVSDIFQTDNPVADMFCQHGSLEKWVENCGYFLQYEPVRFKAYTAFAPILLKLLEIPSFLFEQCCPTGRLKTFSHKLIASMYGNPMTLMIDSSSTAVGLVKITEACTDLPIFIDETSQNPDLILNILYRLANGNTRAKSLESGKILDISPNFNTVILTTGESPIVTENSKGGQEVRRVAECFGISNKVSQDTIHKAKTGMIRNYGHIASLFIRKLFEEKDDVEKIFRAFFETFPVTKDVTVNRITEYYACIATAGYFLEKVFADIKIQAGKPEEICVKYFEQNVLTEGPVPDYLKLLRVAYDFFISNPSHFRDAEGSETNLEIENSVTQERYGWTKTVRGELTINFLRNTLETHIVKTFGKDGLNRFESAIKSWKELEILNKRITKYKQGNKIRTKEIYSQVIRAEGNHVTVIQIPMTNFEKQLQLGNPTEPIEHDEEPIEHREEVNVHKTNLNASEPTVITMTNDNDLAELLRSEGL